MEENDEVLNTANHNSDWTPEYESLIKEIKKKRAEIKRKRDNPFGFLPLAMKMSAQTIGLDLVSVQPMSAPINLNYLDYVYEDPKAKYKKRKKVIDKLLGNKVEENLNLGELFHHDTTNFTIEVKEDNSATIYKYLSEWSSLIEKSKNGSAGLSI